VRWPRRRRGTLLALPLATPAGTVPVRQPVDWIVHSDHRQCGLFTRMTEQLLSTTAERAELLFNFPSDALRPGLQKFDWTEVASVPMRYRVQNAAGISASLTDDDHDTSVLTRAATPAVRAVLAVADRLTSSMADVSAQRVDGTATHAIRSVYTETRPDTVHVPRTTTYLDWRFARTRAGTSPRTLPAAAAARWRRSWSAAKLSTAPKSAPVGRTADDYGSGTRARVRGGTRRRTRRPCRRRRRRDGARASVPRCPPPSRLPPGR